MYKQFTSESPEDVVTVFPTMTPVEINPIRRRTWLLPRDDDVAILLERAGALLRDGWLQSKLAETATGIHTSPRDINAKRFCAIGALERANHDIPAPWFLGRFHRRMRYDHAVRALFNEIKGRIPPAPYLVHDPSMRAATVMYWNDTNNKATVIASFNRTIEKERT